MDEVLKKEKKVISLRRVTSSEPYGRINDKSLPEKCRGNFWIYDA